MLFTRTVNDVSLPTQAALDGVRTGESLVAYHNHRSDSAITKSSAVAVLVPLGGEQ